MEQGRQKTTRRLSVRLFQMEQGLMQMHHGHHRTVLIVPSHLMQMHRGAATNVAREDDDSAYVAPDDATNVACDTEDEDD